MTDSVYSSAPWNAEHALRCVKRDGFEDRLPSIVESFRFALEPVPNKWLINRLTVLWLAMGHGRSADGATAWLHETSRLLADIPHDIVAEAIDDAVRNAERGFIPSVGAIRKTADPILAKRRTLYQRLCTISDTETGNGKPKENAQPESDSEDLYTLDELRRIPRIMRETPLKKGWCTQAQLDQLDAEQGLGANQETNHGQPHTTL